MIAPLVKYTIKGALWYQGETEAGRAQGHIYGDALMTLVQDWRRAFGQGDFPFYWVQLANYGNAAKNGHWMRVQEGQVKATALRNTGVAVINDIGNPTDIHPTNKQDVGRRLALLAQNKGASPLYRQFTREEHAIRIWFDHAGKALKVRGSGPLTGFQIAGTDGKYVAATARIEGATVLVSSPEVPNPQSVRYAWDYNPDANLINAARAAGVAFPDGRKRRTLVVTAVAPTHHWPITATALGSRAKFAWQAPTHYDEVTPAELFGILVNQSSGLEALADALRRGAARLSASSEHWAGSTAVAVGAWVDSGGYDALPLLMCPIVPRSQVIARGCRRKCAPRAFGSFACRRAGSIRMVLSG